MGKIWKIQKKGQWRCLSIGMGNEDIVDKGNTMNKYSEWVFEGIV